MARDTRQDLNYSEIALDLDFVKLQADLRGVARLMSWGLAVPIGIMGALLFVAFAFDLSGDAFLIVILLAAGVPFVIGSAVSMRLANLSRPGEVLEAIVHEEWKTGTRILPEGFNIPRIYRKLRAI